MSSLDLQPEDVRALIHELSVHRIELEAQNEELRRKEVELEASQAKYLDLYHEAPVGYFTVTAQTRIVECNRRGAELLGLPVATTINRRMGDLIVSEARIIFHEAWDRLVATGQTQVLEVPLLRRDGRRLLSQLMMNVGTGNDGNPVGRITMIDVTDRMRLAEEAQQLASIVNSSPHAIASYRPGGQVMSWNGGAEALFGYRASEMIGQLMTRLFVRNLATEEVSLRNQVMSGVARTDELELVRQDGTAVRVLATSSPIIDHAGRIVGGSFLAIDIEEQLKARDRLATTLRELAQSEAELKQADRRKDDFIATLAHELRNPLAPIRNAAAVLRHVETLDRSAQWARDVIERQVGHMATLLEDLLDVSRITRNTITLRLEPVDLAQAIERAIEIVRPQIEVRRHELVVTLPPDRITLEGDLTRLTQIFDNLLSNAAKYTDPGGRITLSVEAVAGEAVVRITDTGIGIDQRHLPRVFELFSQAELAIERAQGGLGIGLALVQGLVRKHGGTVTAHSAGPGSGSEFVVRLPGATIEAGARPIATEAREPDHPPDAKRILVVDDNIDAADSMALMLRLHGYDVATAHSGQQALKLIEERPPQAVLLDVGMPGMNGYEVARRIRQRDSVKRIVLIACTGWGQAEDRRRTEEAGFDHHIVKPGSPQAVLELLATSLEASSPDAIHP